MAIVIKKQHLLIGGIWATIIAIIEYIAPSPNMHQIILSLCIAVFLFYYYVRMRKKDENEK